MNPEFTNYDLTGRMAKKSNSAKIGHNSIVRVVVNAEPCAKLSTPRCVARIWAIL